MKKLTREQIIERIKRGECNFSRLNLRNIDLSGCDLSSCNFDHAKMEFANLSGCNLSYAKMPYADLGGADLRKTNLSNTEFGFALLEGVDFRGATFEKTFMGGANLICAIFDESEKIRKGLILKEAMIGYKKCKGELIVTLEIPKGAIVFSINNEKRRTNKAKVIDISNDKKIAYSYRKDSFAYELGKEIEIEDFDLMYNVECTTGIHFFRTREEAQKW